MTTNTKRNILLNPGPVTTSDSVKQALIVPDICHRETEFTELLQSIRQDLLKVVNAKASDYSSVLFAASGTGAIEACITSVIPNNKKLAVINNGSYGQRMINIAKRYNIDVIDIPCPFDQAIPLETIEKILKADPDITHLAMVHHETSSGILNPLREVGALCRRLNRHFIVDAMSSFAGTEIDMNKDHIDFIMSSSNKCLHGMPGMSFVICNKQLLLDSEGNARSYYFDLHQQYYALEKTGQLAFTPPVQIAYSFKRALDEFFKETLAGRIQRYHQNYDRLLSGLESLGFKCVTPKSLQSKILMSIQFPNDGQTYDFDAFHDYLYEKSYTIYPKKLDIANSFRLACIGDLTESDIDAFLSEVENYMLPKKARVNDV